MNNSPSSRKVPGHGFTTDFFNNLRGKNMHFLGQFQITSKWQENILHVGKPQTWEM